MTTESPFLRSLIGKPIHIVAVDEEDLPPLVLREVSGLGVVASDEATPHFFPWNEIVEISPAERRGATAVAERELAAAESAVAVDSEP